MSRSLKKGPYIDPKVQKKIEKSIETGDRSPITIWARSATVTPEAIGLTFMIHDGRKHQKVQITEEMVGHKFGEFAPTRTFRSHSGLK